MLINFISSIVMLIGFFYLGVLSPCTSACTGEVIPFMILYGIFITLFNVVLLPAVGDSSPIELVGTVKINYYFFINFYKMYLFNFYIYNTFKGIWDCICFKKCWRSFNSYYCSGTNVGEFRYWLYYCLFYLFISNFFIYFYSSICIK